jgi:dipeptidyl aminopeptidase/acylaminoacyl peptidase
MKVPQVFFAALASIVLWSCQGGSASASLYIPHPDDPAKQVEYFVEKPAGTGPWPTVVFLHGHQAWWSRPGGRDFVDWGVLRQFAGRGYLAVSVSQPGYGHSSGPADYAGPSTQRAIVAVIAELRAEGEASQRDVLIQGVSLGAMAAGLVAAHDPSVSGLVMISGAYDLPAYFADPDPNWAKRGVMRAIRYESGGTPEALRARSVTRYATRIRASTLILNGAKDDRTDPAQARALAQEIVRAGGRARAIVYPDFGHKIPVEVRNKDIDPFIDRVLKGAG